MFFYFKLDRDRHSNVGCTQVLNSSGYLLIILIQVRCTYFLYLYWFFFYINANDGNTEWLGPLLCTTLSKILCAQIKSDLILDKLTTPAHFDLSDYPVCRKSANNFCKYHLKKKWNLEYCKLYAWKSKVKIHTIY